MPKLLNLTDEQKLLRLRKQKLNWYHRNKNFNAKYKRCVLELVDFHFYQRHNIEKKKVKKEIHRLKNKMLETKHLLEYYEKMLNE